MNQIIRLALLFSCLFLLDKIFAEEPSFQPALVGNGPKALVNLIDTQKLLAEGQKDALIMFDRVVMKANLLTLNARTYRVYRGTPGSELLQKELSKKLYAADFVHAIANHKLTPVIFVGTAVFMVRGGKPRLRIFANQDPQELARETDFIAPQLIIGTENEAAALSELEFAGSHYKNGAVQLSLSVDASGNVTGTKVLSEDPPGWNFAQAAVKRLSRAKFIPGFRNGKLVACTFTTTEYFHFSLGPH